MKQPPRQRPVKDERDEQIDTHSKSEALDFMIAATQVLQSLFALSKGMGGGQTGGEVHRLRRRRGLPQPATRCCWETWPTPSTASGIP